MKRIGIITFFLLLFLLGIHAEENTPIVEMSKTGKVLHVQELGFPATATLYDVLQLFPELIHRGSTEILPGYALVVDGQEMSDTKYVTIMQLAVKDIDVIEIKDDVNASSARDGASGSIEVTTIPLQDGLSGSAMASVSTETDALLSANVNYQTDRLTVKGDIRADFYNTSSSSRSEEYLHGMLYRNNEQYIKQNEVAEMAKLYLRYTPTTRDQLKLQLWQSYDYNRYYQEDEYRYPDTVAVPFVQQEQDTAIHINSVMALLSYTHYFPNKQRITAEASYLHRGSPHDVFAKVEYNGLVFSKDLHSLNLQTGVSGKFEGASIRQDSLQSVFRQGQAGLYGELTYGYGSMVTLNMGARYQYDRLSKRYLDTLDASVHSGMVSATLSYIPVKGHTFRANGARNFFAPTVNGRSGYTYTAGLHYIFDRTFGSGEHRHRVDAEAGFIYTHAHVYAQPEDKVYGTWSARFRALYQYRWLSLSLSYYYFNNRQELQPLFGGSEAYAAFHNVSITPVFRLPRYWHLSAVVQYTSPRWGGTYRLAPYWQTQLMCSKSIQRWTITMTLSDILHYQVTDKTDINGSTGAYTLTNQYLNARYLLLGAAYRF